jgi:hypothetical protein
MQGVKVLWEQRLMFGGVDLLQLCAHEENKNLDHERLLVGV